MPETHRVTLRGAEERSWPLWLLIAVLLLCGCAAESSQREPRQPTEEQARESRTGGVDEAAYRLGSPALGDPGAPVVMVEYGDFQ